MTLFDVFSTMFVFISVYVCRYMSLDSRVFSLCVYGTVKGCLRCLFVYLRGT